MRKGILSALVLTLALAPTTVGVNAHYDSTLKKSGVKTVLKETKLTVEQAKKQMEEAQQNYDKVKAELDQITADLSLAKKELDASVDGSLANQEANLLKAQNELVAAKNAEEAKVTAAQDKLIEAKKVYDVIKSEFEFTANSLGEMRDQLAKAKEDGDIVGALELEKEIKEFESKYTELNQKYNDADNAVYQETENVKKVSEEVNAVVANIDEKINSNSNELVIVQEKLAGHNSLVNDLVAESETKNAELNSAKKKLDEATALYNSLASASKPVKNEEKSVSSWDDGGPFTSDSCGNVFDRWGNEIWHNDGCVVSGNQGTTGYSLVNTSDR